MDKDEPLDRLLERGTRSMRGVVPPEGCLEPDTIAAWMDGTLPAAERSIAEIHAADCERCLVVLAIVAKTTPAPGIHPRPGWLSLRWLVPVATTAVALIAWFLVWPDPDLVRRQPASTEIARSQPASPPQSAPVEPPASSPARGNGTDAAARPSGNPSAKATPADPGGGRMAPLRQEEFQKAAAPRPAAEEALRDQAESRRADNTARESAASAAPAAAVDTTAPLRTPPASVAAGAGRGGPSRAVTPPSPPRSVAEPAPPQTDAPGALKESADARLRSMARQLAPAPFVIRVPDSRVQWRVSGAVVERSNDDGRSWQSQTAGATVELAAGSAPSDRVCWIVGRAGAVFLTVDGERWQRLVFPDASIDLIGVLARNADTATVTTAAGRTYRTTDRGRTWMLQGLTPAPF